MAIQTIEFEFLTGETPTVKLFSSGSDTVVDTPSATEYTNRKGLYRFTQTDRASGDYTVTVVGSGINAVYQVTLSLTTATFRAYEAGIHSAKATLGTPAGASMSADIAAVKADTGNLVTRITSTLFNGITSLAHWLGLLAGKTADSTTLAEVQATTAGATFTNTTDSLEAIRDRGDAAWAGGGGSGLTGANVITVTVTDGTDPVPGAYVKFRAGGDVEVKRTNGSGVVTFTVDDNTWTISIDATNLTFEPVTLTVTGDDSVTYEMDAVATSGTAWATGDDLVAYFDARTIGQIISDTGTTVAIGSVPSHAVVTRMLLVASGAVNSALMASKRYSEADLSGLDDPSAELLRSITCDIAMYNLLRRRLDLYPDRQEQMRKLSESHLERLRKGEIVLDVQSVKDAGVVSHATFTQSDVNLGVPSIRDQAGYYPARNFSR